MDPLLLLLLLLWKKLCQGSWPGRQLPWTPSLPLPLLLLLLLQQMPASLGVIEALCPQQQIPHGSYCRLRR
jgi:hypothetical protein